MAKIQYVSRDKAGRTRENHVHTGEVEWKEERKSKPKGRKGSEQVVLLFVSSSVRGEEEEDWRGCAAREGERVDGAAAQGVEVPAVGF